MEPSDLWRSHGKTASESITFTTGANRLSDETPDVPVVRVGSMLVDLPDLSGGSCSHTHALACTEAQDAADIEVIARRGDEILLRELLRLDKDERDFDQAIGTQYKVPDCLEFRRRSPTGARSEPVVFCGDALRPQSHAGGPYSIDVECKQGEFRPREDPPVGEPKPERIDDAEQPRPEPAAASCGMLPGTRGPGLVFACIVVCLLAFRRRRRS